MSVGKRRVGNADQLYERQRKETTFSSPEAIAKHLFASVHVAERTAVDSLPPLEHWINAAMVTELAERARKQLEERARQEASKSGGSVDRGAGEASRPADGSRGEDRG